MADKILIIRAEDGRVVKTLIEEGVLEEVVKKYASQALSEWEPIYSDFIVLKDKYEVRLKLPIKPEQYEIIARFRPERTPDGYAVFNIPIYTISFDNFWDNETYKDRKMYLIAPYVDEAIKAELEAAAADSTNIRKQETLPAGELTLSDEEIEEMMKEAEELEKMYEEEKTRRGRGRRRKRG